MSLSALTHAGGSFVIAAIRTGLGLCEYLLYVSHCDACNLVVGAFEQCCLSVVVFVKFSLLSVRSSLQACLSINIIGSVMSDVFLCTHNFPVVCHSIQVFISRVSFVLFFDDIDGIVCFVCCVRFMHTILWLFVCVLLTCIAQARLLRSPVSLSLLDPFLIV